MSMMHFIILFGKFVLITETDHTVAAAALPTDQLEETAVKKKKKVDAAVLSCNR